MNLFESTTKKSLGLFAIVMINVIAVDSLRTLPFSAVYGTSLIFYFAIAALTFFLPVALVSAELATGWPNRGGIYVWVREAFGELPGFIVIWLQWIYNVVWYPTILTFIAATIAYVIDPSLANNKLYNWLVIMVIFWGATLVNCFGMKISSLVSAFGAIFGTILPMLFIMLLGMIWIMNGNPGHTDLSWQAILPNRFDADNAAFFLAILFGLVGMEVSAAHADEVKNPGKTFPRAIAISAVIILFTLVFASLAIAVVVPKDQLNIVTGLLEAYRIFFAKFHMSWMTPLIAALIVLGAISGAAAWIISPTKGLLMAAVDGSAPKFFSRINRYGAPVNILISQGIIVTLISSLFLLMPTVSSTYWVLTVITAQLALLVYVGLFAAAIYLKYKKPEVKRDYTIPAGKAGMWLVTATGILVCIFAIALGFLPPDQLKPFNVVTYEVLLISGILLFVLLPLIIFRFSRQYS